MLDKHISVGWFLLYLTALRLSGRKKEKEIPDQGKIKFTDNSCHHCHKTTRVSTANCQNTSSTQVGENNLKQEFNMYLRFFSNKTVSLIVKEKTE